MPPKRKTYIKNCTGEGCSSEEKRKSHNNFLRAVFYFLLVAFGGTTIFILFFSAHLRINKFEISGTKELNALEIENLLREKMDGKYFGFLPKNNFLFVLQGGIQNTLTDKYKKIRSVEVEKKFPDSVSVEISEHEALLIWCKGEADCYLLNEDGIAYNKADFESTELSQNKLLKVREEGDLPIEIGSEIISKEYETYLLNIKKLLLEIGIEAEDNFSTPSRMAEEIRVRTSSGYGIYFSTQFSLESAIKTLSAIFSKEITKEKILELEYIDLRSEYKAFYKYKNSEPDKNEKGKDEGKDEGNIDKK